MAEIVVAGGGICGLSTAMLLAGDGHAVTVLERDPEPRQRRQQAWLLGAERRQPVPAAPLLPRPLPDSPGGGTARGTAGVGRGRRPGTNPIAEAPEFVTGGPRPGDEEFWSVTGRRPVMEAIIATSQLAPRGLPCAAAWP